MRIAVFFMAVAFAAIAQASELTFQFNSPAFSGIGYSTHLLTIEQLESNRKQKLREDAEAQAEKLLRDAQNTNLNKFLNNLESRVYATLSKQLADQLFADNGAQSGTMELMGNRIDWTNDGDEITLTVTDEYGSVTTVVIPVGDFKF